MPAASARNELKCIRKDGDVRWADVSRKTIDYAGKSALLLTGIDVTERTRAEAALRESEEKFRVLAETTPAGIILYRGERFIYANPVLEKISGYTCEELLGRISGTWYTLITGILSGTEAWQDSAANRCRHATKPGYSRGTEKKNGWNFRPA